jgi:hypothetical protein
MGLNEIEFCRIGQKQRCGTTKCEWKKEGSYFEFKKIGLHRILTLEQAADAKQDFVRISLNYIYLQ